MKNAIHFIINLLVGWKFIILRIVAAAYCIMLTWRYSIEIMRTKRNLMGLSLPISAPLKLRKLWDVSGPKAHSHIDDDDKQYENDTSDLQQIICRGVVSFFSSIFLSLSLARSCSVSLGWFRSHLQQIIVLNKQNRVPHDKSSIDLNRITAHTVNWMCHITPGLKWSAENMLCTSLIYNKRAAWLGAQTFHCFQLTTTYYTRITWFYQMSMKIVWFQLENENPKNLVGNQTLYRFMEWS